MILYEDSQRILRDIAGAVKFETVEVNLEDSVGRVLAADVLAREPNPPFDNSAMDGFAVKISKFSVKELSGEAWIPVMGILAAGDSNAALFSESRVVEIMTGAPMPGPDFDSVVRVEDVQVRTNQEGKREIRFAVAPEPGQNIRRAGEDMKPGDLLLKTGLIVQENHLLALAAQGIATIRVKRRLSVGVMSTGQEIVDFRERALAPGQIRNSTGVYLEKVLTSPRVSVKNFGIVADRPQEYKVALLQAFEQGVELVVSTGAVSMGIHDFVRATLEELGAKVHFHKCAIRPGKPILFATLLYNDKTRYIFGIPGNPVSTVVGYNFFIKPFLGMVFGMDPNRAMKMKLSGGLKKAKGLRCFLKARVCEGEGVTQVHAMNGQASFMVSPLLESNAWIILPEQGDYIEQGREVEVLPI
jgi:molybdopterin molybdotransferase